MNGTIYMSVIFVGVPETMGDLDRRLETHMIGAPDLDYYGEQFRVIGIAKMRDLIRFTSEVELVAQILRDIATATHLCHEASPPLGLT